MTGQTPETRTLWIRRPDRCAGLWYKQAEGTVAQLRPQEDWRIQHGFDTCMAPPGKHPAEIRSDGITA
jgi:hypothetical protein